MEYITIQSLSQIYLFSTDRISWKNLAPRDRYIMAYQLTGQYDHTFDFGKLEVRTDTVFLIGMEDTYAAERVEYGESLCFTFTSPNRLETMLADCSGDPRFRILFKKLFRCRNLRMESNYYAAMSVVYEIFSLLARKREVQYLPSDRSMIFHDAMHYINEHFSENTLDLTELPHRFGVSAKYFRDQFRLVYGATPTQYLLNLRLNTAAGLLSDGILNVSETAEAVGFSDVYYFNRLFKKRFLCTPGKYRTIGHSL